MGQKQTKCASCFKKHSSSKTLSIYIPEKKYNYKICFDCMLGKYKFYLPPLCRECYPFAKEFLKSKIYQQSVCIMCTDNHQSLFSMIQRNFLNPYLIPNIIDIIMSYVPYQSRKIGSYAKNGQRYSCVLENGHTLHSV